MRSRVRFLFALLAAALVGCSSGTSDYEAYRLASAETMCSLFFDCALPSTQVALLRLVSESKETCIEMNRTADVDPGLERALRLGTIRFDRDAYAECAAGLRSYCSFLSAGALVPACQRVFVGTVATGGACSSDQECATGTCEIAAGESCGTCTPPTVPLGGPCTTVAECMPAAEGSVSCGGTPRTCRLDVTPTVVRSDVGGSCSPAPAADGAYHVCAEGLLCDASYVCRAPVPLGGACDPSKDACAAGGICLTDAGLFGSVGPASCRLVGIATRAGEPCAFTGPSPVICSARENLSCDGTTSTCKSLGDGRVGSGCLSDRNCRDGLFCGGTGTPTCTPLLAMGASCTSDHECSSDHCAADPASPTGKACADAAPVCGP